MEIQLRTLTPLWTGGLDQTADRLHETGLIGSLRWWYEALVRGLGGSACDPTGDGRCEYNPKNPLPPEKQLCPACYLFGCTGWARLFRLRVIGELDKIPLHFCTTLPANKRWLRDIFRIDGVTVPFGKIRLEITGRNQDEEYALNQLAWTIDFAAQYGGLGAKLQHGFGQVVLETNLRDRATKGEQAIKQRRTEFCQLPEKTKNLPSRARFFVFSFSVSANHPLLRSVLNANNLVGTAPRNAAFIPCVFDLRYKGDQLDGKQLGFRQWLLNKRWSKVQINALLGETRAQHDEERSASRLCMGMPWLDTEGKYAIKVFGFVPSTLSVEQVSSEIREYILQYLFKSNVGEH